MSLAQSVSVLHFLFFSLLSHPCCSLLAPQSPSSLPTGLPRTPPCVIVLVSSSPLPSPCPPLALVLIPCSLCQHRPSSYFLRYPWTPNSLDLWIFPGSPLDLPFVSWAPVSGSLPASPLLLLLFHLHLHTLASQSPHITLSRFYLWSLVPPLTSFHIDTLSCRHHLLSYSLDSTMTHSPWLIASSTSYINP